MKCQVSDCNKEESRPTKLIPLRAMLVTKNIDFLDIITLEPIRLCDEHARLITTRCIIKAGYDGV